MEYICSLMENVRVMFALVDETIFCSLFKGFGRPCYTGTHDYGGLYASWYLLGFCVTLNNFWHVDSH